MTSLKRLTIEHLRGSVVPFSLPFEAGKRLTVIYGENAAGKTTICDAFDFLGNGKVGSLENRGLGKTSRYWHSVGKKAADVVVSLQAGDSICKAKILKGGEISVQPAESRPRVEVLRRSQILSLVEAKPAERYAAISRFIDVSGVEAAEASLRELIRTLEHDRETAVARVQENLDSIQQFWETAGRPGSAALAWAEKESAKDTAALSASRNKLSRLRAVHESLVSTHRGILDAGDQLKIAEDSAAQASKQLEEILTEASEQDRGLLELLESAKVLLKHHPDPKQCPLCESPEKVVGLSARVGDRLKKFSAARAARDKKSLADRTLQLSQDRYKDRKLAAGPAARGLNAILGETGWPEDIALPPNPCPNDLVDLATWLEASAVLPDKWKAAESSYQDNENFFGTLRKAFQTYRDNAQAQQDVDVLLPRLQRALEIAEEERHRFTDEILAAIAGEVGRLYETVHPGEGLSRISLLLDPNKRASLEIGAKFHGQAEGPPQAYFSDSHLDTLGLCVFLALAALDEQGSTILVLDDVLASVDEPHVERLIEMLFAQALKYRHSVITTHYRPWKQKLRWGWLQNGQCQFVELTKWTTTKGLTVMRSVPDIERLRKLLEKKPPDPQEICAKAGVVLEAGLDFLTLLYECRVPRRPEGRHTLGDLLPSINKKLRQALQVEVLDGEDETGNPCYRMQNLGPLLDELDRIAQARNVFGSHFSEMSFDLLEDDACRFGGKVLELLTAIADPVAGWPRNDKSGSYWSNAGETRRLHPLKQPQ